MRLAPLTLEHVPGITVFLEPEIFEHFNAVLSTHADVEAHVAAVLQVAAAGTERPFVILERDTGTPVGTTRSLDFHRAHRTREIGNMWRARRVWHSPMSTECKFSG